MVIVRWGHNYISIDTIDPPQHGHDVLRVADLLPGEVVVLGDPNLAQGLLKLTTNICWGNDIFLQWTMIAILELNKNILRRNEIFLQRSPFTNWMRYFWAIYPHLTHLVRAGHVEDGPGGLLVQGGCPAVGEEDVVVSDLLLAPRHLALVHHRQVCSSKVLWR